MRNTLGGYELVGTLSSGGMGHVYLAERSSGLGFRKRFALKTIRRALIDNEDSIASFIDEARLVAQLEHKNIAQVFDFGFDGEIPYLAMEFVRGAALQQLVTQHGRIPPRAALEIVREAAAGLDAAHNSRSLETGMLLGVVHRDISLSNIMVSEAGEVKLVDFGIALAEDRMTPATLTGTVKGKPGYMSPEQLNGDPIDARSDVFALWVVFVEMIRGAPLFTRRNIYETTMAVMQEPSPKLSEEFSSLPRELDGYLAHGLAKKADERMSSAAEIVAAMDALDAKIGGDGLESLLPKIKSLVPEPQPLTEENTPFPAPRPEALEATQIVRPTFPTTVEASASARKRPSAALWGVVAIAVIGLLASLPLVFTSTQAPEPPRGEIEPTAADTLTPAASRTDAPPPPESSTTAPPDAVPLPANTAAAEEETLEPPARKPKRKPRPRPHRARKRADAQRASSDENATEFGYLTVFANPFARVRVNGTGIGVTPILKQRLPAGQHTVELLNPDDGTVRKKRVIELTSEQTVRVTDR